MIFFNKLNISLSFYWAIHGALTYITICSVLFFSLLNIPKDKDSSYSNYDKDAFISNSIQNSVEYNTNERHLRQKISENSNYSIHSILSSLPSQIKLPDLYDINNHLKTFSSILVTSPNSHSFRGPPSKY